MSKVRPSAKGKSLSRSDKAPQKRPDADQPPSFEALRSGIEAQLQKKSKKTTDRKKQSDTQADPEAPPAAVRGKKRSRNGDVIAVSGAVRKEVRELGGTAEDIALLAEVESDSEIEGTDEVAAPAKKPAPLDKGIANILKEIELAKRQHSSQTGQQSQDKEDSQESDHDDSEAPAPAPVPTPLPPKKKKKGSRLRVEPRADWYADIDSLTASAANEKHDAPASVLTALQSHAEALLAEENEVYRQEQQPGSQHSFYNTVVTSGTLSDKISALSLAVQESPIHNVKALEALLGLSKKRSRAQAVDVLRALKDLLAQGSLLPSDRRLYHFPSQPGLHRACSKLKRWVPGDALPRGIEEQHLIAWAFEDWLKHRYFDILQTLEVWCNDEIEFAKSRALSYVYELLREKAEQESNLLRLLVNKLGDPVKKIASQASYLLRELLQVHPAMKGVVVSAIETDFIFRPGQSLHGKYYATITLNQTALSSHQSDLAVQLLGIYFGLFSSILKTSARGDGEGVAAPTEKSLTRAQRQRAQSKKTAGQPQKEDLQEKLISAILTGVNRAYPYASSDDNGTTFSEHLDTLFKIAHSTNFNTSIQAMLLIQQLSAMHQPSSDRFYRLLYESLLDPRLVVSSKQQMYLNLLHRSLKADLNSKRVMAFVKRILQILSLHEPSFICGAFFLLKDLDAAFPSLLSLVDQPAEADLEEEVFKDVDDNNEASDTVDDTPQVPSHAYNAHKRAPEHANADNSCAWELIPYLSHFHPSVLVSAEKYLTHDKLPGKPDLSLHTLMHFLDRFAYKNAKLSDASKLHGSSIMQPLASENTRAVLLNPTAARRQLAAVNTDEFKAKDIADVAAEDVFFHQYFHAAGQAKSSNKAKKQSKDEAEDLLSDDEDAVWDAMMKSAPELDMDDDEDDLGMSDLDSDMGSGGSQASDAGDASDDVDVESGIFDDSGEEGEVDAEEHASTDAPDFGDLESDDGLLDEGLAEEDEAVPVISTAGRSKSRSERKKLKSLPVFASADDYAAMIDNDEDEDLG
ncbi:hypothetical protein DV735_g2395, partial [Chaetothyriales sp. CBS 134920]